MLHLSWLLRNRYSDLQCFTISSRFHDTIESLEDDHCTKKYYCTINLVKIRPCNYRPWLVIYLFPVPWFIITPYGRAVIFYYCINNIITLLLLADIQFNKFYNWTGILLQNSSMQAIYKTDINLQNHQYSNHTPKFSLNKRVWPTKLLIISVHAGAKIACGRGTGNYYITSDGLTVGLIKKNILEELSMD